MTNEASRLREGVRTVGFMLGLTILFITAVSVVHLLTRERVEANAQLFLSRALLEAGGLDGGGEPAAVNALRQARLRPLEVAGVRQGYALLDEAGGMRGYVFVQTGAGLWGSIDAAVGVAADGGTLIGVDFFAHNETPGLGARIEEAEFRDQFKGKQGPLQIAPEGGSASSNQFDALTGATKTTQGVLAIVNQALADAQLAKAATAGEGGGDGR